MGKGGKRLLGSPTSPDWIIPCHVIFMTFCSKTPQLPTASGDLVRKVLSHLSALRSLARATLPQMAEFLRQSSSLLESRQETTVGEGKPLIRARLMLKVFKGIFFKQFSRFFETLGKADAQNLQRTNNFFDKTFWNSESSRVALGRRDIQQIQRQGTASDFSILAPPLYVKQACEERLEGKYLTLL